MLALVGACSSDTIEPEPQPGPGAPSAVEVVAEGLLNPVGLALMDDGSLLIAEEGTGENDTSAGVSVLTADRRVGRIVDGLPSGRDSGDLSGAPLVGVAPDGDVGYVAHFGAGRLFTFSIPADGFEPATKDTPAMTLDDLGETMVPLNEVTLTNPFDIAFDTAGAPVVSDASQNGVATVTPDGLTVFTHRIGSLQDPKQPSIAIDPVPTGITRVDDEFFVTLTGGCPYPADSGVVVALGADRSERVVTEGLNMPIDVELGPSGTIWVLEFAQFDSGASCFTGEGYLPGTGKLSRLDETGRAELVLDGLDYPGAVVEAPNGDVYVTEIFAGRVLRLSWQATASQPSPAPTPDNTSWRFEDRAAAVGLDFQHGAFATSISDDPAAAMGGGVCWIDYDADGWLDLYLVNSHALAETAHWEEAGDLPHNELYRNDNGQFTAVGEAAGVAAAHRGNGCISADFDQDGDADLLVTADGPNLLYSNDGDGTFTEVAETSGVAAPEWSSAAAAGDLNGDGLIDLFVGGYIDLTRKIDNPSGAFPQDYLGIPDRLYLNKSAAGQIRFEEVTAAAGLVKEERALGALMSDLDLDGDLDLYVANDGQPNRLYRNDTPRNNDRLTMTDITTLAGVGDSGSGMGIAGGDYDGDGSFDLLVTNWEAELNALYANRGAEAGADIGFSYMTMRIGLAGLGNNKTGWGVHWIDVDRDRDLDMLIIHGRVPVTNMTTDPELVRLYGNLTAEGSPGEFRDWTALAGLESVGSLLGRGSAAADYDNDGDLDVAINTIGGRAHLLVSAASEGAWISLDVGKVPGTRAVVTDGTVTQIGEVRAGSSYLAGEDHRLVFGLGGSAGSVTVEVRWPDDTTQVFEGLDVNQLHRLRPAP